MIKLILLISLSAMTFHFWQKYNSEPQQEVVSENGFIAIPKPTNLNTDSVIILAAKNCTKDAARRADDLAYELSKRNISVTRASNISFQGYDPALKGRLDSVMRGPLPIVLVDGRGKANPSLYDVIAEYDSVYE